MFALLKHVVCGGVYVWVCMFGCVCACVCRHCVFTCLPAQACAHLISTTPVNCMHNNAVPWSLGRAELPVRKKGVL